MFLWGKTHPTPIAAAPWNKVSYEFVQCPHSPQMQQYTTSRVGLANSSEFPHPKQCLSHVRPLSVATMPTIGMIRTGGVKDGNIIFAVQKYTT